MTRALVIGTTNRGKLDEYRGLLHDLSFEVRSLNDFPPQPALDEDGATFSANAIKKARTLALALEQIVLSDDSGLEIDALAGAPGLHSARFAGPAQDPAANIAKVLDAMKLVADCERTARFRCVIAVARPDGAVCSVEGSCEGVILRLPRGSAGFGYDPIFLDPASGLSFAEMSEDEKNRVSHRAMAVANLRAALSGFL